MDRLESFLLLQSESNRNQENHERECLMGNMAERKEKSLWILLQVCFPLILAGFGMVGAGILLSKVQHWTVFQEVSQLFILVPALLGLKGNLEMTLASRLSTLAHQGELNHGMNIFKIVGCNLALIQCQGISVGFIASIFAIIIGAASNTEDESDDNDVQYALMLAASSAATASLASLILGSIMSAVIVSVKRCNLNPDNIATPIAAALGDLLTLSILAYTAEFFFESFKSDNWLIPVVITLLVILIPVMAFIAKKEESTSHVLINGWTPVLLAMVISSISGVILDYSVDRFPGMAVYQPLMNGVGGNLAAVQASKLSTHLHTTSVLGILPQENNNQICQNPLYIFTKNNNEGKTARVLLFITVPGHLLFTYAIYLIKGNTVITPSFMALYLIAACFQVITLLILTDWLINLMWIKNIDPDNSAIPYLTAIGDFLGNLLLLAVFICINSGSKNPDSIAN